MLMLFDACFLVRFFSVPKTGTRAKFRVSFFVATDYVGERWREVNSLQHACHVYGGKDHVTVHSTKTNSVVTGVESTTLMIL